MMYVHIGGRRKNQRGKKKKKNLGPGWGGGRPCEIGVGGQYCKKGLFGLLGFQEKGGQSKLKLKTSSYLLSVYIYFFIRYMSTRQQRLFATGEIPLYDNKFSFI